ncbi:MAG: hypothetical protein AUI09_00745 [Gemmatimonadetes bacterium 13_2_20CM_2_66_5]|nr:MAG: hypothetical protein AUI09_00745 [Gemmatimonadetes bacterium 13_2_20CM_2_66_5]
MKRAAPPPREQARELAGDRRQPGTAAAAAAAGRGEYLGAERMLHRTDAVQARAVTPADDFTSRPDRPGALHRVQKTQVARSHEKRAIPIEPQLVARLEVGAQRESFQK